jgi:diguanylate cyclase (GGDEF)-like protein
VASPGPDYPVHEGSSPLVANVLLVDDRPENLVALEAVLEPLRQNLVTAASGAEALKRVLEEDFAVILLDVQMPELDGFETASLIKQRERSRHVPIIFLTALDCQETQTLRAYAVGAVDYLTKPYDPTILRSKVEVFIGPYHQRRQAEALAHQALHDELTGLPGRVLFRDRVGMALSHRRRRPGTIGVLYFDLDGFKAVNDSFGHEAGDELLATVAKRVAAGLRPSDTLARFGGDEFTVLCDEITERSDLAMIAHRISAAVAEPLHLSCGRICLTTSIGISVAAEGSTPEALVREADAAMYLAKRSGGGRHEIFDGEMRQRAVRRVQAEVALGQAVERGELRLHYQPKFEVATGSLDGLEALVRWQSPERGLLAPAAFIGLAEETGVIVPLGEWVLVEALEQARRWRAANPAAAPICMSVNVSARQLALPSLVERVARALEDTGTDPSLLCLEITESAAMTQVESTFAVLSALKELGLQLAIDDFGTGYSSLAYLRLFPLDVLKIDRSFVSGLHQHTSNSSIVGAVITLARALELRAVAEGVEQPGELAELHRLGCDVAQGYLLGRPQPAGELTAVVTADATSPGSRFRPS